MDRRHPLLNIVGLRLLLVAATIMPSPVTGLGVVASVGPVRYVR